MNYYVIVIWNHKDKLRENPVFYAEDSSSGGYPWFSPDMRNAAMFTNLQKAVDAAQMWFSSPQRKDERFPSSSIHGALRLNFDNRSGSADVEVVPLTLDRAASPALSIKIEGTIRDESTQARAGV